MSEFDPTQAPTEAPWIDPGAPSPAEPDPAPEPELDPLKDKVAYIGADGVQRLRDMTDEEQAELDARRAAAPAAARARIWELIKAERDRRMAGGVLAGGKWFHTDTGSRIQQLGLKQMGASVPNVQWKTMDGTFAPMTQTLAGQIFLAVASHDIATFAAAETHRAAMEAAEDPATYDFSTGWPAIYGEAE